MIRLDDDDLALLSMLGPVEALGCRGERAADRAARVASRVDGKHRGNLTPPCYTGNRSAMVSDDATWQASDDVPLYTMALIEKTAGVTKNHLRQWLYRRVIQLRGGDAKSEVSGLPNHFTLRSVLMISVTAELVRLGAAPKLAGQAAEHWMTSGVVEGQVGAPARREAGGLFPLPLMTYLMMAADGGPSSSGGPCELVGVAANDPRAYGLLFAGLFAQGRPSARVILLNAIDDRVRQACREALLGDAAAAPPDWEKVVQGILAENENAVD